MNRPIRILMLEDNLADAALVQHELREEGIALYARHAATKQEFLHELLHHAPDVILSDHGVPGFSGLAALSLARAKHPHVPFIFVTGRHGEEEAVESIKQGAADYVLKDRLFRLGPAMRRALDEAEERALKGDEEKRRRLAQFCPDALFACPVTG